MNNLHTFLRSRRSIRQFKSDPVPVELIRRILETSIWAPSAHHLQPWRFVVLTNSDNKSHLAKAIVGKLRQDMIADQISEEEIKARVEKTIRRTMEAPVIVVICQDISTVMPQPDAIRKEAETLMGVQSVAMAGLQLLLAAHSEGVGGTWICWPLFAPIETSLALELDPNWKAQGMIFLGYPAEDPDLRARIPVEKVTRYL
jgi:coenzyme F420-0:L-glutamate ligase / coenzyme F420-1:gamma-L-glutamate ligase